jgi:hypothetical protein
VGEEEASDEPNRAYRGAGGKTTRRRTLVEQEIALGEVDLGRGTRGGTIPIPPGASPTLALERHRIDWSLRIDFRSPALGKVRYPFDLAPSTVPAPDGSDALPRRIDDGPVALWLDPAPAPIMLGQTVSGGFEAQPDEGHVLRSVECALLWTTEGAGKAEMEVLHYEEHVALEDEDLSLYHDQRFRCPLRAGPPSHDGPLFRVRWLVRVRLRYTSGTERVVELPFRVRGACSSHGDAAP